MAVPWYYHGIIIFQKLQKLYFQQNTYPYFFAADITYERRFGAEAFSTVLAASVLHTHTHTQRKGHFMKRNMRLILGLISLWSVVSHLFSISSGLRVGSDCTVFSLLDRIVWGALGEEY